MNDLGELHVLHHILIPYDQEDSLNVHKFESIKLSDCPKVNEESNTMATLQCWALRRVSKKHVST